MDSYYGYTVYCECRGLWHVYDIQHNDEITYCYCSLDDIKFIIRYAIAWGMSIQSAYEATKNNGGWYLGDKFKQNLKKLKTKLKDKKEE